MTIYFINSKWLGSDDIASSMVPKSYFKKKEYLSEKDVPYVPPDTPSSAPCYCRIGKHNNSHFNTHSCTIIKKQVWDEYLREKKLNSIVTKQ